MKYLFAAVMVLFFAANGLSSSKMAQTNMSPNPTSPGIGNTPGTPPLPSTTPGKPNVDLIDTPTDAQTSKTLNQDGVEVDPMTGMPVEQKNFKSSKDKSKYEKKRMDKMKQRELHLRNQPNSNPLNNQNPNPDVPGGMEN